MKQRIIGLVLAILAGILLLYLSRFWVFNLWSRDGLVGIKALRPNGSLLAYWLRGTDLAPFELIIWAVASFMALTYLEKVLAFLKKRGE